MMHFACTCQENVTAKRYAVSSSAPIPSSWSNDPVDSTISIASRPSFVLACFHGAITSIDLICSGDIKFKSVLPFSSAFALSSLKIDDRDWYLRASLPAMQS